MSTDRYYPVPDPTAAASYVALSATRVFMGDKLVEYRYDADAQISQLWQVGDSTTYDPDDAVMIASLNTGFAQLGGSHLLATPTQTLVQLADTSGDDETDSYWICGDGDDGAVFPAGVELPWPIDTDQRLEDTFRAYRDPTAAGGDWILRDLPALTDRRGITPDEVNTQGSVWAGIITGDTSTEAITPDPPDPFEVEQTINGFHTSADSGLVFTRENPDDTPGFSAWAGAMLTWTYTGGGSLPTMGFGFSPFATRLLDDIPVDTPTAIPDDDTTISEYIHAYFGISPGSTPHIEPGALGMVATDTGGDPDVLDHVEVTITGTADITPVASYVYRQGQYRFTDDTVDETSSFDDTHLPGSEVMHSDFVDVDCDRFVAVLGILFDANDYGTDTGFSIAVYAYNICAGTIAPLRLYPRGDDLGVDPSPRNYPPPRHELRNYSQEPTY